MFKDNTIRRLVEERVRGRVEGAQKDYDRRCAMLDKNAQERIDAIHREVFSNKSLHANDIVNELFGSPILLGAGDTLVNPNK